MSLAGLGAVCIWHDLSARGKGRVSSMAQPGAHAGAGGHPRVSPWPALCCIIWYATIFQPLRGRQRRSARRPGLFESVECADRMDATRRTFIPSCVAIDLPRRSYRWGGGRVDSCLRSASISARAIMCASSRHCAIGCYRCFPTAKASPASISVSLTSRLANWKQQRKSPRRYNTGAHLDRADGRQLTGRCGGRGRSARREPSRLARRISYDNRYVDLPTRVLPLQDAVERRLKALLGLEHSPSRVPPE